ncbi:hypothetical protein Golob_026953 [Gossypium lobatum]|uniref:RNase H type-1 domain-containing protein n=1 Tax=Gossypium lobatum TaxID=34289 RepID=A0A7J8LWR8_9ROSI|nr:hypothetical protein [Gossypium lobatum]
MEDDTGISNSTIIRRIHQMLKKLKQWKIQYVPKGSNLIADSLAKIVCIRSLGLRLFVDRPLRI